MHKATVQGHRTASTIMWQPPPQGTAAARPTTAQDHEALATLSSVVLQCDRLLNGPKLSTPTVPTTTAPAWQHHGQPCAVNRAPSSSTELAPTHVHITQLLLAVLQGQWLLVLVLGVLAGVELLHHLLQGIQVHRGVALQPPDVLLRGDAVTQHLVLQEVKHLQGQQGRAGRQDTFVMGLLEIPLALQLLKTPYPAKERTSRWQEGRSSAKEYGMNSQMQYAPHATGLYRDCWNLQPRLHHMNQSVNASGTAPLHKRRQHTRSNTHSMAEPQYGRATT